MPRKHTTTLEKPNNEMTLQMGHGEREKKRGNWEGADFRSNDIFKKSTARPEKNRCTFARARRASSNANKKTKGGKKKEIAHAKKKTNAAKFVKLKIGKKFGKGREDCEELGDEQCSPPVVKSREHPGVESLGSVLRT